MTRAAPGQSRNLGVWMRDELTFITEDGSRVTLDHWLGQSVLLVFMRWLG